MRHKCQTGVTLSPSLILRGIPESPAEIKPCFLLTSGASLLSKNPLGVSVCMQFILVLCNTTSLRVYNSTPLHIFPLLRSEKSCTLALAQLKSRHLCDWVLFWRQQGRIHCFPTAPSPSSHLTSLALVSSSIFGDSNSYSPSLFYF
jgi:hypothetical protein